MRVLITNDDGAHAAGIGLLAHRLASRGVDVVVVAPATEASGSSAGLGQIEAGGTVPSKVVDLELAPGVEAHAMEAPPAMCVLAGLTEAFGPVPDVVLSGVNNGHNLGRAVIHSGTVGAALTARMLEVPALALSAPALAVEAGPTPGTGPDVAAMKAAADLAVELLTHLDRWPRAALNVNVPGDSWTGLRPARLSNLGAIRLSIEGHRSVQIDLETRTDEPDPPGADRWPTDLWLVTHGYASITPLSPVGVASAEAEVTDLVSIVTNDAS
jgi:5'-nucleotidase